MLRTVKCRFDGYVLSKLVLGQTGTTDVGQHVGTANAHERVREDIEQADAAQLAATLQRDLVRPLVDLNLGQRKHYPKLIIARPDTEDVTGLIDNALKIASASPEGFVEISVLRDKLGLPEPAKGAACIGGSPSEHWATVWQQTHQSSFTVARSAGFDILGDIHAALMRVQVEGRTLRDFERDLIPILKAKGWWGKTTATDPDSGEPREVQLGSSRRLRTIYDVNLRVSQAQGNWQRQQEAKASRPYLRYVGIVDNHIRPQHKLWHGRVLPVDHSWWKVHYPPNGWKCRCSVMSLSEADLERFGFEVSGDPAPDDMVPWRNPATGAIIDVPRGIDPGWAYNPGAVDQAAHIAKVAMDKLVTLPPAIGAEAVARLAFAFPQVERELGDWLEGVAREALDNAQWKPTNTRRVVGCVDREVQEYLKNHVGITLASAAISIEDGEIMHLVRAAKQGRGNEMRIEEVRRLPSLLGNPDAVFWDEGKEPSEKTKERRDPGLIYVWNTGDRNLGKIVVRVNYKTKLRDTESGKRQHVVTNTVRSGRVDIRINDLNENDGYFKIKGNP